MVTILLVDDHPAICFAVKVTLEKEAGFQVNTSDGEHLLGHLHRDIPDLLLLDLELNGSDGLDSLPRIRQHFPALKILIYTNRPAALYARRALLAGCRLILEGYHCFPRQVMEGIYEGERSSVTPATLLSRLSDRELTVLHYLKRGKTPKQIADSLQLSNKTISTYKVRMLKKCGAHRIEELYALLDTEGGC